MSKVLPFQNISCTWSFCHVKLHENNVIWHLVVVINKPKQHNSTRHKCSNLLESFDAIYISLVYINL